jgi:hypothetical protein
MRFDDDALDRALFAQPLEEPPAGLRSSILAATIYRPAPPFSIAEIVALAGVIAAACWLAVAMGPVIGDAVTTAFSHITLLLWLGAGIAVTLWLEIFTVSQPAVSLAWRAKRRAKP